jgi:hypothetical protein
LKTSTLETYYAAAIKQLPRPSAGMIVELVEEVQRLRALHTKRRARRGEDLDDDCEMMFGQYQGERLADLPDDYLIYWRSENPIDSLSIDAQFGQQPQKAIAQLKLRLHRYIAARIGQTDNGEVFEGEV